MRQAYIIVDMWDKHWIKAFSIRTKYLASQINDYINVIRGRNNIIIHAPCDTGKYYLNHPARRNTLKKCKNLKFSYISRDYQNKIESNLPYKWEDPGKYKIVWKRQSKYINIDEKADYISTNEIEILCILNSHNIDTLNFMGVHSNGCILFRRFGILNMQKNGIKTCLIGNLSDCMWDKRYTAFATTHDEANQLILKHINNNISDVHLLT
jgi:hypothetical protein